jgi:hypothetical protein
MFPTQVSPNSYSGSLQVDLSYFIMMRMRWVRRGLSSFEKRKFSTVNANRQYKYFENPEILDDIAIVRINCPGKMNTISKGMQSDAEQIFRQHILTNKDIKAVIFISSKPDNFIAGADIHEMKETVDKTKLLDSINSGHALFTELKNSNKVLISGVNAVRTYFLLMLILQL